MAAGKPIVCTDYEGHLELMTPETNALISPRGDADAFAANVIRLVNDENLRSRLANNAFQYAQKNFSPQVMAKRLELIYSRAKSDRVNNGN
jgi:glycosyltransferase involved in cell wall biosynthesis